MQRKLCKALAVISAMAWSGCTSEPGTGRLRILLKAEASISEGLARGSGVEESADYAVRFSKYLVTVGNVRLKQLSSKADLSLLDVFVADLKQVGEQGVELDILDNVEAGQWDKFAYETPAASAKVKPLRRVSRADMAVMVERRLTYWIEGEVPRSAAEGAPVRFVIQTEAATRYQDCTSDGEPGVSVTEGGTSSAALTLHGDHLFFNSFPTGTEGNIKRLAGWVIRADVNGDGLVTTDELAATDATEVFTREAGYSLDGANATIETALDFVRAQLTTQGHLDGEGECVSEYTGTPGT